MIPPVKNARGEPSTQVRRSLTIGLLLGIVAWITWDFSLSSKHRSASLRALLAASLRTHGVNRVGDRVIIVARYKEDSSWVDTYFMDTPHVVITPGLPGATYTTPFNKGHEVGPFLHYIIENYDRLPAHMAFVHGHRVSHHTYQLDIVGVLKAVRWGSAKYIPLNVHMYQRCDAEKPEFKDIENVWPLLFKELAPKMPSHFLSWCCAQFVVTRAAVRARPKAFYENVYAWVTNTGAFAKAEPVTSFISSRVLEQTWHMIFGMPAQSDMIPPCDVFDCDVLDVVTAQIETWEGTPFDRIPNKVYEVKHNENVRARASPRPGARGLVALAATQEELKAADKERQAWEEGLERRKDADMARRASGELRETMKEENKDVFKLHFGYGQIDDPGHACVRARARQRAPRVF